MGARSGGGGRGLSASARQGVFGRLSQGRPVRVFTSGGIVNIENAPSGVRSRGFDFVATGQRGFGNGFNDSRAALTSAELRSFLRQPGVRLVR